MYVSQRICLLLFLTHLQKLVVASLICKDAFLDFVVIQLTLGCQYVRDPGLGSELDPIRRQGIRIDEIRTKRFISWLMPEATCSQLQFNYLSPAGY